MDLIVHLSWDSGNNLFVGIIIVLHFCVFSLCFNLSVSFLTVKAHSLIWMSGSFPILSKHLCMSGVICLSWISDFKICFFLDLFAYFIVFNHEIYQIFLPQQLITDVNIAVAVEAIQAIGNLAKGLRTHFSGNSRFLLPVLLVSVSILGCYYTYLVQLLAAASAFRV